MASLSQGSLGSRHLAGNKLGSRLQGPGSQVPLPSYHWEAKWHCRDLIVDLTVLYTRVKSQLHKLNF